MQATMDEGEDKFSLPVQSVDEILFDMDEAPASELLQTGGPYDEEDQSEEESIPVIPVARASPKAVSFDANVKFPPECDEPPAVKMKPEALVEKLKLDLAKAKTELASERSNRKRKEKSLIKLAKELSNRVVEEKEYMNKIAKLEETNKDLESRLVRHSKIDTTETSHSDADMEVSKTGELELPTIEREICEQKLQASEREPPETETQVEKHEDKHEDIDDEAKEVSELALSDIQAMKELISIQEHELTKCKIVERKLREQLEELGNDKKSSEESCESCLELGRQLEKIQKELERTEQEMVSKNEKESAIIAQLRQQLHDARREADIAEEELATTLTKREYSQEVVQQHLKMSEKLEIELDEVKAELERTKIELDTALKKNSKINLALENERNVNTELAAQLQSSTAEAQQARDEAQELDRRLLAIEQATNKKLLATDQEFRSQIQTHPVLEPRSSVEESIGQQVLSDELQQVKSEAKLAQQQIFELSKRLTTAENSARNELSLVTDNLSRELTLSKAEVERLKIQLSSSLAKETSMELSAKENIETIQKLRSQLQESQAEATSLRKELFAVKQTTAVRAARVEEKLIIQLRQELLDSRAEAARQKSELRALCEKCESSEWLQQKLQTLRPDFKNDLPKTIDTLDRNVSWYSKSIRLSVIFKWIAFAMTIMSMLTARFIMLHKTAVTDAFCAPVIPGHEFREPLQARFEAPWWAPQAAKKQAFTSICGERIRTRLEFQGDKVTIYALHNDSPSESIRSGRIGFGLRCGYEKLIIKNRRGSFEEAHAPWSLKARRVR